MGGIVFFGCRKADEPTTDDVSISYSCGYDDTRGIGGLDSDGCYHIYSVEDLQAFADYVNNGNYTTNAILYTCLNLSSIDNWTPIGTSNSAYTGIFDGGNHTIYNLSITSDEDYVGFFGVIESGGKVMNLFLNNPSIIVTVNNGWVGGVAGHINEGAIDGCRVSGGTVSSSSLDDIFGGGIVGCNYGTVIRCENSGTAVSSTGGHCYTGGVIGYNNGTVTGCKNSGDVTATGDDSFAGGIVGCDYHNGATITDCTNSGTVTVTGTGSSSGDIYGYEETT